MAFVNRWRWPLVIVCLLAAMAAASGGRFIEFKNDYRYFFTKENPQLSAFETLQKIYTKNDNILIVVDAKETGIFEQTNLQAIDVLTEGAWKLPFSVRVDSITNFQHSYAEEDDLIVEDLFDPDLEYSAEALAKMRAVALAEPMLHNRLINEASRVSAINVQLELPRKDSQEATVAAIAARKLIAEVGQKYPNLEFRLTGNAMLGNAFFEASQQDLQTLVPLMYLFLILTLFIFLRSITSTLLILVLVGMSAASAMGAAGWAGVPLTPPSATAPTIILTLAVADGVHVLVIFLQRMYGGMNKLEAMTESLRLNVLPVFLTSITTAIGLLSMNMSEVQPFRDLGNITTVGVTAAFVFSIVFLPAAIMILPVRRPKRNVGAAAPTEALGRFVVNKRKPLLIVSGLVIAVLVSMAPTNILDDQFVEYFDDSFAFRRDTDFTTKHLTGVYQIEYSLNSGGSGAIAEPAYLATVDSFTKWFRAQPGVIHVAALPDTFKRLNKNLNADDPAFYRLPDSRELAAQYLLLYEMSLPYGLDLNNQIDVDKSATRFTVTTDQMPASEFKALAVKGEAWLQANAPPHMQTVGSSTGLMFSYISERNVRGLLMGTFLALLLISGLMVFALRSVKYGVISLVPNVVPACAAFGLWALIDGQIDLGLSVVATVSLGIVVDDSVHFLTKYLRGRREENLDALGAIRYAFSTVGSALVVTSVVLIVGFGTLATSPFSMNSGMGILTAITLFMALAADLIFLPPLLAALEPKAK